MNDGSSMANYPIQWSEGMLLSPHHFQQNDIYWARQIHSRTALLQPYYWGIDHIQIDESQLAEGTLTIMKLRAVFKDGLLVDYDAEYAGETLRLALKEHMAGETKLLRIFVNVPIRTEGAASQKSTRRYASIEGGMVPDENTGQEMVPISRLKPVLSLSKERLQENYTSLPLLEVEISLDGAYRIAPYIPPLLKISSFREMKDLCLQGRLTQLLLKLRKKANQLAGITAGKEEGYGTVISEQHAHIIRHMVSGLPQLEVLSFAGTAHPFEAFERLAALTGQLCSIGKFIVPPLLPRYNHEDMAQGFSQALKFAEDVVDSVSLAYSSVVLAEQEDGTFSITVEKTWLARKLLLEVTYAGGQREDQLLQWIQHARIGSGPVLKVLAERRMPGARLHRVQRDEQMNISARHNSLLFTLQNVSVEVGDEQVPVIEPGQKLYLKGLGGKNVPASVVLHIANEAQEPASA